MPTPATPSSGNVFLDLGFSPEEAALLAFKSALLRELGRYVDAFDTQAKAAEALDVSQPRISEIANGRLSKFSTDLLLKLCSRAGLEVTPDVHTLESA